MDIAVEISWFVIVSKVSSSIEQVTILMAKLIEMIIHFVELPFRDYQFHQNGEINFFKGSLRYIFASLFYV